jgi:GNAT superfamily N-acetyltransferase
VTVVEVRRLERATAARGLRALVVDHARFERSDAMVPEDWAVRADRWLVDGRLALWVAEAGSRAIGYATLTRDVATWTGREYGHLDCLFVAERWRGSGAGRALLAALRGHARAEGLDGLQWQTPAWNRPAVGFYERAGATHVTKERFALDLAGG